MVRKDGADWGSPCHDILSLSLLKRGKEWNEPDHLEPVTGISEISCSFSLEETEQDKNESGTWW